jgi:hypothetical protein
MRLIASFALAAVASIGALGCSSIAISAAPDKTAAPSTSENAKAANAKFWETLHGGRYEDIPQVADALTAAYLANPRDPETALHLGLLHLWRINERARLDIPPPTITDEVIVARKYFSEAMRLSPADARIKGFLASTEVAEGKIHGDEKLARRGYFDLMDAKDAWPEFNLFVAGVVLSRLPATDSKFADGVEYQWQTLDLCAEEKVDRKTASYAKYMSKETLVGPKRVCWNSWMAPHNFEGFCLNMGDMIVARGDPTTAKVVYANAKLSKTYGAWPYRRVLEERIAQADENVAIFRAKPAKGEKVRILMGSSSFACMGCHQESGG